MFAGASVFNQPIGTWNTSKVIDMSQMFVTATIFDQPIGSWNTSNVINMNSMFAGASAFNQNISAWNVTNVTPKPPTNFSTGSALTAQNTPRWFPVVLDANGVTIKHVGSASNIPASTPLFIQANPRGTNEWFAVVDQAALTYITGYAKNELMGINYFTSVNSGLIQFNNIVTTHMTDMRYMFNGATTFNQDISSWDTSKVTDMNGMFTGGAGVFNQPIGSWNTSNVINMNSMFANASAFNQSIGSWDTSSVMYMTSMFSNASAFNQNIRGWNVANVLSKPPGDFSFNSALTSQNTPSW